MLSGKGKTTLARICLEKNEGAQAAIEKSETGSKKKRGGHCRGHGIVKGPREKCGGG